MTDHSDIELTVRHSRIDNILIGLMLIVPIICADYFAIVTKKFDFLIFTFIMTVFLGWFAYNWIKNGIQKRVIVQFDNSGVTSYEPKFFSNWADIYGYRFREYSGKTFMTLTVTFIFDNGKTSTTIDVSYCDKKINHFREYLSKRLKEFNEDEYGAAIQKRHE